MSTKFSIRMVVIAAQLIVLCLWMLPVNSQENTTDHEEVKDTTETTAPEILPLPEALIGEYPHDFFLNGGFSSRSFVEATNSEHSFTEQGKVTWK